VLVLLGFAATDFIITITLSAADATAHVDENPFWPSSFKGHEVIVTLLLIALLGAVFLKGFTEAIGIAVALVAVYLILNVVVIADGLIRVAADPGRVGDWSRALTTQHGNPLVVVGIALLVFPKLALGLSGFETGVAVMPHITGDRAGRIRGAKRLLTTAAVLMSAFLISSSVVTTVLIPQAAFRPGGPANGRALAYLAHQFLGSGFGGCERAGRAAAAHPGHLGAATAHLLRVDRGQSGVEFPALPHLRPGRGGAGDPRDAAPGRTEPRPPPARPRRLSDRLSPSTSPATGPR
jgi:hypothetical protein